ncbi:MAG: site-specific DNA-methyltransferase [Microcoleus sp. PH2017_29_MFU_D_A]|jgi:modification methylase|uniref:DNA-methyltransferase n=1 Tax=unclassified Microcoleus TaxID=2642155 RepID=UPI001E0DD8BE|nr:MULTISPECIES: site-specific DNA-methyltransferase [unclassified Microcoleus]MCC3420951.1 site-specific DNA-methyltransferase [Microcoleus sp. PH2017_07_MST_O_A]MCC3431755.1 site-specific DNA-methyltransferase [Microcoleus sp. PH2017_04_SCI_O_A]MCC3441838.1 site-specific DNA-methyltransferase [Microcoleus sp. PH2017_03_ELD_O_A]MCC3467522.1 site-specific DNA-methyltransferase [Microcoleus sp. PH2017_06_SFM_O_A]MCC3506042.1 site-specific DNA-methyltransferase [Microcoleus sp. PH2017_19_SFW_U_A
MKSSSLSKVNISTRFLSHELAEPLKQALQDKTLVPEEAATLLAADEQRAIPAISKNAALIQEIQHRVQGLPSFHSLLQGDSRNLTHIPDESVHLVVTSPPYWNLKEYLKNPNQLGEIADYEQFLQELDRVWEQIWRVLVPGGRLVIVVGDVCVARRRFGRHMVFPLHASIQENCRHLGFDNLAPIIWYKIANASLESAGNGTSFLGKPYEPGGVIKNDIEFILMQRKPGGYRSPSLTARVLSVIPETLHRQWFQQIWQDIKGASTKQHPAPYPLELAERLVRMFSFAGDTVLDPFMGTGTTCVAAANWGRNSIGVDVEPNYHQMALKRMQETYGLRVVYEGLMAEVVE